MRYRIGFTAGTICLVFASTGIAAEVSAGNATKESAASSTNKLHLGLRSGFALPMGLIQNGPLFGGLEASSKLTDEFSSGVPIWLDAGYLATPNVMVGAFFQYAFLLVKSADGFAPLGCSSGADCHGSDVRFGLEAHYYISPGQPVNPWFGLGVGYEIASMTSKLGGYEGTIQFRGFEFVNIQAGSEFKVAEGVGVGPFLAFSVGQYSTTKQMSTTNDSSSFDIDRKGLHEWLTLGAKGSFNL